LRYNLYQPNCVMVLVLILLLADDNDDLEMYGSEATTPAGAHHISYSFEVCMHAHIPVWDCLQPLRSGLIFLSDLVNCFFFMLYESIATMLHMFKCHVHIL